MKKKSTNKSKMLVTLAVFMVVLAGCGGADKTAVTVEAAQMINPIKAATPEDFEAMGIHLELPANENWIQDATYTIIDQKTAQIHFHDAIAGADMTLRAGKEDIPAMAGIYYSFDDEKEEQWFAINTGTQERIEIRMQYAVSEQQVKGVLISWSHGDFNYTLWGELNGQDKDTSSMAKTAVYVAEHVN